MRTIQILLLVCTMIASQAYAQIKVGTDGKAAVGKVHSLNNGRLKIGNDGIAQGLSFYDNTYGGTDFRIYRENNIAYFVRGDYHGKGLRIRDDGRVAIGTSHVHNTINNYFGSRFQVYTVGNSCIGATTYHDFDYGDAVKSTVYRPLSVAFAGWYNGDKTFSVLGNGEVFSTGLYVQSDASTKKNIQSISSSLAKVLQLRGVSFDPVQTTEAIRLDPQLSGQKESLSDDLQDSSRPQISQQVLNQMNLERSRKRMGVVAQEVEAIVPEVVRTTPEGRKTVAYHELVGLLIEAIKEQQVQIEELKSAASSSKNMLRAFSGEEEESLASSIADETLTGLALYQNTPNPFNERTEIRYSLTGKESNALIYIFSMQGTLIKKYIADSSGVLTIEASELTPGMYIYTLVADGKEVGSKRMILTN